MNKEIYDLRSVKAISCNAYVICTFESFSEWVNMAKTRLGNYKSHVIVCLDINGNECHIGEDFMAARDNDLFPVIAYAIVRTADLYNYKK